MELSKDLNLPAWKRSSAAACYAAVSQQKRSCMISASGEMVCAPQSAPFYDGTAVILGQKSRGVCTNSHNNSKEPFQNDSRSMQRCIDGSMASMCVAPTQLPTKTVDSIVNACISNTSIISSNGRFRASIQGSDGNFVLYDNGSPYWSINKTGYPNGQLCMQGDGNLVTYHKGAAYWASGTISSNGPFKAIIQNDGNFVIYDKSGGVVWTTNTVRT